jgi:hypothetical protein
MIESLDKVHEIEWLWLVDHGNQRPHERLGLYLLCCIVRKTETLIRVGLITGEPAVSRRRLTLNECKTSLCGQHTIVSFVGP